MFISDIEASQVHLSYQKETEKYVVSLRENGSDLAQIELSPSVIQSLVFQALAYMPHLEPSIVVKSDADAHRKQARFLKDLDNRSIQLLLREVRSDELIDFLWYMRDSDLLRLVHNNMSKRAGEMLLDDLEETWAGKNPDEASAVHAGKGQQAIAQIMRITERLIREGQIPDHLEYLKPKGDTALMLGQAAGAPQHANQSGSSHG